MAQDLGGLHACIIGPDRIEGASDLLVFEVRNDIADDRGGRVTESLAGAEGFEQVEVASGGCGYDLNARSTREL